MCQYTSPDLFQVFVFSLSAGRSSWERYDWDRLTTVVMVGYTDVQLVCTAHKYGVRAITIGAYTVWCP